MTLSVYISHVFVGEQEQEVLQIQECSVLKPISVVKKHLKTFSASNKLKFFTFSDFVPSGQKMSRGLRLSCLFRHTICFENS